MIQQITLEDIIFSPNQNAEDFILQTINKSKKNLFVMAFWFTWKPIADAIISAFNRGVEVGIILDSRSLEKKHNDVHLNEIEVVPYMKSHGLENNIKIYDGELFHYKVILCDNKYTVNGSCNFFNASLNRHEENYMLLKSQKLFNIFKDQFDLLWKNKCTTIG